MSAVASSRQEDDVARIADFRGVSDLPADPVCARALALDLNAIAERREPHIDDTARLSGLGGAGARPTTAMISASAAVVSVMSALAVATLPTGDGDAQQIARRLLGRRLMLGGASVRISHCSSTSSLGARWV